jgi:hypothetical protein
MTIADYFAIGVLIILALWGVAASPGLTVDQANEADSRNAFVGHSYNRARKSGPPLPFAFGLVFGPLEATAKLISAAKLLSNDEARRIVAAVAKVA